MRRNRKIVLTTKCQSTQSVARSKARGSDDRRQSLQPAQVRRMLEPPALMTDGAAGETAFAETVGATFPAGVDNVAQ